MFILRLLIVFLFAFMATTTIAPAHDYQVGALKIDHPWSRATPNGTKVGAGYLSITNTGTEPDRLIGGSLIVAGKAELHAMKMEGSVMRMNPVPGGLEIKPGQTVKLAPGGYHFMFLDLTKLLQKGEMIDGTLIFEKAGTVQVSFQVEAVGATTPRGAMHDHMH